MCAWLRLVSRQSYSMELKSDMNHVIEVYNCSTHNNRLPFTTPNYADKEKMLGRKMSLVAANVPNGIHALRLIAIAAVGATRTQISSNRMADCKP